ncbi:DNA/RNA helicase domain-containing protein [uncultured Planococcus sp.]|uniref:DNA/RNA helicase domain-containing protein n=1 Tax=uncultured Planococcus sp. TaxID=337815 RepID=UPI002610C4C2|nr:DNA/RNA helicase domain-containing protein [uncultured Planococcus sp.]
MKNSCLTVSAKKFFQMSLEEFMNQMKLNYIDICGEAAHILQENAWKDSFIMLNTHLSELKKFQVYMIFEYVLPREGGRRPDLLIVTSSEVLVIEFKEKARFQQADVDQVSAYTRDIQHYHQKSLEKKVISYLVPTQAIGRKRIIHHVTAISPDLLLSDIKAYCANSFSGNIEDWLNSSYEPLPSIVEAAKLIYSNKKLPSIHRANSSGLPEALAELQSIVHRAKKDNKKVLILATGIPGSGKTLLGLQFVYETYLDEETKSAIFLSGNGPLVQVLQDALESKVFIQPLRNFIKHYGFNETNASPERIIVFDEAQRAWDREQVNAKHRHDASEPELLIQIADKIQGWTVVLGLVGEGQEIHIGEEAGISQWAEAVTNSEGDWEIYSPSKLQKNFKDLQREITYSDKLDLNTSLRSHIAEDVSQFATMLLGGSLDEAGTLLQNIYDQQFSIYLTRDLEKAKRYVKNRYFEDQNKRYGLIASSRSKILPRFGVDTSFQGTSNVNIAKWFNEDPLNAESGCSLKTVATEFSCQGLELDFPIVSWGEDLVWKNGKWSSNNHRNPKAKDAHLLRINSYRVLLTRGRDGMIIYIPQDPQLDETYKLFKMMGLELM